MKKLKLTESQIVKMLSEHESGYPAVDLCRKYKIANSTFYKLKSRYSGMNVSELKRLKELERENTRLKSMYANLSLDHELLQEIVAKKFPGLTEEE